MEHKLAQLQSVCADMEHKLFQLQSVSLTHAGT